MQDPLNEPNISPYKVKSIIKALQMLSLDTNVANVVSNVNASVSLLNDLKGQNETIISLLQQLVSK